MLTLSPTAATVLTNARTEQGIPEEATLRIAAAPAAENGQQGGISLGFVDQPMDGDEQGEAHGLSICVAPEIAPALADQRIDIHQDGDEAQLVLVPAETD